jgi:hypothetical protein
MSPAGGHKRLTRGVFSINRRSINVHPAAASTLDATYAQETDAITFGNGKASTDTGWGSQIDASLLPTTLTG